MALTRTYYRVAEHLFAVESSNTALWNVMSNYEPFRVERKINDNIDNVSRQSYGEADRSNESEIRTPCRDTDMECDEHSDCIFTLRVERGDSAPQKSADFSGTPQAMRREGEGYTHVVTDNAEEDMPRIEVYRSSLEDARRASYSLEDASLLDASLDAETATGRPKGLSAIGYRKGWLFRVAMVASAPICCEMECSEDFTEGVLRILPDCQDIRFCIDNALMLLFAFRTAPMMTLEMHAAVVVRPSLEDARGTSYRTPSVLQDATLQAKGYLFLGHSGTGKSTHARQWLAAFDDAWLLNDDNPILRVMEDGEVRVYGSPWSGKTLCYNTAYARVGGIVKLSQAPHNKIRTISLPEAYAYILSSASGLKMDRQMADHLHETVKHVVMNVACYHLECLPNTEAAEECWEEVRF